MKTMAQRLLQKLTEAHGAPGHEEEVRQIFKNEAPGPWEHDRRGGIYCVKQGSAAEPRVLVAGHMDEVGWMVQSLRTDGLIRFAPLGGWWGHVLLAQRVRIKARDGSEVLGVITAKPPHFLSPEERKKVS